ncbi:MAG: hypothetical protein AWU54_2059 [Candidatus Frackibacter sp. T328-2]|nr:MAG: hypothetical protein AWU54_2059 [Candidatus Frackibacter sp. T328-2]
MSIAKLFSISEKRKEFVNEKEKLIRDLFKNDFNKAKKILSNNLQTMAEYGATKCKIYFLSVNDDEFPVEVESPKDFMTKFYKGEITLNQIKRKSKGRFKEVYNFLNKNNYNPKLAFYKDKGKMNIGIAIYIEWDNKF